MAKKKKKQEVDPQSWMLSFSDLLTNMLTFFVLLYSMSSMNNLEFEYTLGPSLRGALGCMNRGDLTSVGKPKFVSPPMLPNDEFALIEDAVVRALMSKDEDLSVDESKTLSKNFQAIEVYSNSKFAQILFPAKILFRKNSAELLPQMARKLEGIAVILQKFAHPVRINGYSRSSGDKGDGADISLKRAAAVLKLLISKEGGVPPERCSLAGYGNLKKKQRRDKNEDYVEIFIIKATNYTT